MEKRIRYQSLTKKFYKDVELLQLRFKDELNNIWTYNELKMLISQKQIFSEICLINKKVIGFSIFKKIDEHLELYIIFVSPKHRRLGIGRDLILNGINFCKKKFLNEILIEVNINNSSAISFYKKLKFTNLGIRKNYYNVNGEEFDALLMVLNI